MTTGQGIPVAIKAALGLMLCRLGYHRTAKVRECSGDWLFPGATTTVYACARCTYETAYTVSPKMRVVIRAAEPAKVSEGEKPRYIGGPYDGREYWELSGNPRNKHWGKLPTAITFPIDGVDYHYTFQLGDYHYDGIVPDPGPISFRIDLT